MARRKKTLDENDSAQVKPEEEPTITTEDDESAATVIEFDAAEEPSQVAEQRGASRVSTDYEALVQFRESADDVWKERTVTTTFSKNGAAVILSRELPVGRLVSTVLQLPSELRVYDHKEPIYPMLGIVQHCFKLQSGDGDKYNVGLAFIGKVFPESFKADPTQCYRLTGVREDGLWSITEAASQFQARQHSRFWRKFKVNVTVRDDATRTSSRSEVLTRDISAGGMSFSADITAKVGDRVKVVMPETEFFTLATIRNISGASGDGTETKIFHLEFDKADMPVDFILGTVTRTGETSSDGHGTPSKETRTYEDTVEQLEAAASEPAEPDEGELTRF